MYRVVEYCKGKGADRTALDARFGGGESLRETLNALEQLRLIVRNEPGDVRLSDLGDRLAYAPSDDLRRQSLIEALLLYPPYRVPLERAVNQRLDVLDAPTVEHLWQVDMRLGQPRNRVEEARTFFFRLADDAGIGTYRRGVRGQTTRLELTPAVIDVLAQALAALPANEPPASPGAAPTSPQGDMPTPAVAPSDRTISLQPQASSVSPDARLTIHVDMSGWELDKIEAFLTMIGYLDRQ